MIRNSCLLVVTNTFDRPEKALYAGLAAAGFRVELFCRPDADGQSELADAGVRVSNLIIRHRLDRQAIQTLRHRLAIGPCDIIYAPRNNCLSAALIASRGRKIRIVAYRGTCGHITRWSPGDWLTYLHPRVDRIICVSEAVRRSLIALRFSPDRLFTIYKGHDVAWYDTQPAAPLDSWRIPEGAFVVGFVGNMRPVKGIYDLILSSRQLKNKDRVHYLLVGDIRDKSLLPYAKNQTRYPNLHFTGFQKDASSMMKQFSLLAMPSIEREGFPKAVIEAMAQGIVPIVTRVGGMPEIVQHNVNGLIIPPGDPAAMARAVDHLMDNPDKRHAMGKMARQTIAEQFSTRQMIEQTVEMFAGLLS